MSVKQNCFRETETPGKGVLSESAACVGAQRECCLREVPEGTHVRVRGLRGCGGVRSRLCALGFTPGTEITVCGSGENGCRVQVRDTCVVLDCGSAESILCDDDSGGGTVENVHGAPAGNK